jgi:hypothetical protein
MKVFILFAFNFAVIFGFSLFFERSNHAALFQNQQQEKALLKNQELWFRASDYVARRDFLARHLDDLGKDIEANRTWISDLVRWINKTPKNISLYEIAIDEDSIDVRGLAKSDKALQSYLKSHDLKLVSEKGKNFKASGAL